MWEKVIPARFSSTDWNFVRKEGRKEMINYYKYIPTFMLVTEYKTVYCFLPRACWIGLGFCFHEMKIRYTGTLVNIIRQPYPANEAEQYPYEQASYV
jgi:hypothetical protein